MQMTAPSQYDVKSQLTVGHRLKANLPDADASKLG